MAVIRDKNRKTFYIRYTERLPDGTKELRTIRDKAWSFSLGIRYMRSVEASAIAKDRKERAEASRTKGASTFGEACDRWLAYAKTAWKSQTAYGKALAVRGYIVPALGSARPLASAISAEGGALLRHCVSERPVSPRRMNQVLLDARQLADWLEDDGLVGADACSRFKRALKPFSSASLEKSARPEVWTKEEYDRFRATFSGAEAKWGTFFDVVYYGALRIGEALGLRWKCVMPESNRIVIEASLSKTGSLEAPKNASSSAPVELPKQVMEELEEMGRASLSGPSDFCFFPGRRTSRTSVKRIMDRHADMAGVKRIRVHALRHSMASHMIASGCNVLMVSRHLRHSSTQQTLDTYAHLFPGSTDGLMERLFGSVANSGKRQL